MISSIKFLFGNWPLIIAIHVEFEMNLVLSALLFFSSVASAKTLKVTFNYYKKILSSAYDTSVDIGYYDIIPEEVKFSVAFKDE